MNYESLFSSLGMSGIEARTYTTLLSRGPSSATEIERIGSLHRPHVYKALATLLEKGLVRKSPRGKRTVYVASSPDALLELFKNVESSVLSDIEDLHSLQSVPNAQKPIITFSEGDHAIRDGYRDMIKSLKKGSTYYRYSPGYHLFDRDRFLPKGYQTIRDSKQLERFVIADDTPKSRKAQNLMRSVKIVPRSFDLFDDRIGQIIYDDKVFLVDYESQSAVTIHHKKFAELQKKIFKLLYSKL